MKYYILFFLAFILFSANAISDNYEIKVKLDNCKESNIYLAYYFEGKVFVIDTAKTDINGKTLFSKNKSLHGGLYLLYLPSKKYVDLIIGKDQKFSLEGDANNLNNSIKIKGSKENIAFQDYQLFMREKRKEKSLIIETLKKERQANNTEQSNNCKNKIDKIDDKVRQYIKTLSEKFPDSALSSFINLTLGPNIPDFEEGKDSIADKNKEKLKELYYYYNKNHYWDNTNFSDSTILRTPIFKNKLDEYFNKIVILNPDTIYNESVKLIEKTRDNKPMFRYIVSYCFNNALNSKIMGMDAAFVNIAKKYYLTGEADWVSTGNLTKIKEEVEKTEFNLIGMKGKDIKLPTMDGEWVSLHETEATLTLLIFWEPDCGHCKKQIPQIKKDLYDKYKNKGLKVFSVYTQKKVDEWEEFVEKHELYDFINCYDPHNQSNYRQFYNVYNTPVIFLLNKNKEIIAKKVDIKTLGIIIKNELK